MEHRETLGNCCERRLFPGGAHMEDRETLGRAGEPPPTRRQLAGDERGGLPQHQTRYKPRKNGPGNLQPSCRRARTSRGPSTTRTTSSVAANTELLQYKPPFRMLVPSLVGDQVPIAVHLLHSIDAWQQSTFGGQISVQDNTQTDETSFPGEPSPVCSFAERAWPRLPRPVREPRREPMSWGKTWKDIAQQVLTTPWPRRSHGWQRQRAQRHSSRTWPGDAAGPRARLSKPLQQ